MVYKYKKRQKLKFAGDITLDAIGDVDDTLIFYPQLDGVLTQVDVEVIVTGANDGGGVINLSLMKVGQQWIDQATSLHDLETDQLQDDGGFAHFIDDFYGKKIYVPFLNEIDVPHKKTTYLRMPIKKATELWFRVNAMRIANIAWTTNINIDIYIEGTMEVF